MILNSIGRIEGEERREIYMSTKIASGGDVDLSTHRGEIAGLVERKKDSLLVRYWRELAEILNSGSVVGGYPPTCFVGLLSLSEFQKIPISPLFI